jgi:hypothetical protein
MNQLMRPRGEVSNAEQDTLSWLISTRKRSDPPVEGINIESPHPRDLDDGQRVNETVIATGQWFAISLCEPENGDRLEAAKNVAFTRHAVVAGLRNRTQHRCENVESTFTFAHLPANLFPLADAPRIIVPRQRYENLVRPRPATARRVIAAVDKHGRERFGQVTAAKQLDDARSD